MKRTTKNNLAIRRNTNKFPPYARSRLNALLAKATEKPLVIVHARAGYGKTCAVYDFTRQSKATVLWIQLSEQDNLPSRFWESFVSALTSIDKQMADQIGTLDFPNTEDKLNQYFSLRNRYLANFPGRRYLMALDDFHLLHNAEVIRFLERVIEETPENRSVILIGREFPQMGIAGPPGREDLFIIQEEDLNFTKNEVFYYLRKWGLSVESRVLHEILQDTNGWAFAVNFIVQSLSESPNYAGNTRTAVKKSIFEQIETNAWRTVPDPLKHFLIRLSLIEHLSASLVESMAAGDDALLAGFKEQNAYIYYNNIIDTYLIHPLFLEFLHLKKDILNDKEVREAYRNAAEWFRQHGFTIAALDYYEKIGDYESVIQVLRASFMTYDLAIIAVDIFERAPAEVFGQVEFSVALYLYALLCLGRWQECLELGKRFEKEFLKLPKNSDFQNQGLGSLYFILGFARLFMGTKDGRYDFDRYFAKMDKCLSKSPMDFRNIISPWTGAWVSLVGSARAGAPQEFIDASIRTVRYISHCRAGILDGQDDLLQGELKFYQGDLRAAKTHLLVARERASANAEYDPVHRAWFYLMRIAVMQGDHDLFGRAFQAMTDLIHEENYKARYIINDITAGAYWYLLRRPEMIPGWLTEGFAPYAHSHFIANFGNQITARYYFLIKNFPPLLNYIAEMRQREFSLYGRIELLAIEACVHYQMKDKARAFAVLREACEMATPNDIVAPFIELGKNMRTLTAAALRGTDAGIPAAWLKSINSKTHLYAKCQVMIISKYDRDGGAGKIIPLSPREMLILQDLCAGLSRADIAARQNLSVNTVNMNVRSIYTKLQAKNTADIIRIAVEMKMV